MKNYVIGYLSFFENDLKMFKIQAESEYEAVKKTMIEVCSKEEYKESEIEWQNSEDYPQDLESLMDMLYNSDIAVEVVEV